MFKSLILNALTDAVGGCAEKARGGRNEGKSRDVDENKPRKNGRLLPHHDVDETAAVIRVCHDVYENAWC